MEKKMEVRHDGQWGRMVNMWLNAEQPLQILCLITLQKHAFRPEVLNATVIDC